MNTCLLVIDDGRGHLDGSLAQAEEMLPPMPRILVRDDDHRLGFAGAIREGWREALDTDADYIFHLESDFAFRRPVPLDDMVAVLRSHPQLVQMALLRQPVNEQEKAAGGLVQQRPHTYALREDGDRAWLEHSNFVTTNPCVWPRWVVERGWPQIPQSEGHFGIDLFASDPSLRAAFWGRGEEWVEHLGSVRAGVGY